MLVDDHALVRSAIRQAITTSDIHVVAECGSADEALERAPAVAPDLLLLDVDLPGMSGVELVRELAPRIPGTKIVMLTVSTSQRNLLQAVRHGAVGYLTKDLSPDALLRAVRGIARGDLAMSRSLAATVIEHLAGQGGATRDGDGEDFGLSARELHVLTLLAEGLTDREIADRLTVSPRTIESHVSNVLRKLGTRNRAEATRIYRRQQG